MAIQNQYDSFNQYAPQSLARAAFANFTSAGIDKFTTGVSQNPNLFLDLTNVLPGVDGAFRRRWGLHDLTTINTLIGAVRTYAYNVPQDASNTANTAAQDLLLTTDNANWQVISVGTSGTAATPLSNTLTASIFSGYGPSAYGSLAEIYAVVSRNWFYYANGVASPRKVNPGWVTGNTDSNWGIASPAAYYASGDTDSTAVSTISAVGGTGQNYTSPTCTISGGGGSGATCTAVVQAGMITGFLVGASGSGFTSTPDLEIEDGSGTGASGYVVVNDAGVVTAVLPTGPIILNAGRTYTYAWKNSVSGHCSDIASGIEDSFSNHLAYVGNAATVLSPALGVLGDLPVGVVGFTQILITISPVGPFDTQVDTLVLLATSDGGSLEKLYEVKQIAVTPGAPGTITYTDTLPDTYTNTGTTAGSGSTIAVSDIEGKFTAGDGSGLFRQTETTVLFTQSFNSLMFNSHPSSILPGYSNANGNQDPGFRNNSITDLGTWSDDVQCQNTGGTIVAGGGTTGSPGTHFNFQMSLTGNFIVGGATSITFTPYIDASFAIGVSGASYVSGPQVFGGNTTTQFESYPVLAALNNNTEDWHDSYDQPFVLSFPAAGVYPFEINYATANHDEREMALLANSGVIVPGTNPAANYNGLTLLNANLWVDTDQYGQLYGIINNDPPPGNIMYHTAHQGRLFTSDGQSVFFSKSIDEVTTSTGLITSKWEEAFPGTNVLPIALGNERITGLKSDGTNLHIGTDRSIYTLTGSSAATFSIPNLLFQETGVMSHDLWSVVYAEGQPAGYIWVTPDLKVMYSDFNTYDTVGTAVYPLLQQWDSTFTGNAKFTSMTYGPYNFCVLMYRRAGQAYAEFLLFETTLKQWYRWTVPGNTSGPLDCFVYQHPETSYRGLFMVEASSGETHYRLFDPAYTTDNGQAISWNIQTSWNGLNDPMAFKILNELELLTDESSMNVSIYGAKTQADLESPTLLKSGTLVTGPLHTLKFYCAGVPTSSRYYSFQFNSTVTGTVSNGPVNVLTGFDVEHYPIARI